MTLDIIDCAAQEALDYLIMKSHGKPDAKLRIEVACKIAPELKSPFVVSIENPIKGSFGDFLSNMKGLKL